MGPPWDPTIGSPLDFRDTPGFTRSVAITGAERGQPRPLDDSIAAGHTASVAAAAAAVAEATTSGSTSLGTKPKTAQRQSQRGAACLANEAINGQLSTGRRKNQSQQSKPSAASSKSASGDTNDNQGKKPNRMGTTQWIRGAPLCTTSGASANPAAAPPSAPASAPLAATPACQLSHVSIAAKPGPRP